MRASKHTIGTFALAMIAISAIVNLRGIPTMASMGLVAVTFYLLAALTFLIPSALVSAELASTFPEAGGIYTWVTKAMGKNMGFLTIWMEWINNVIALPATLSALVLTLSFAHLPSLAHNKVVFFVLMIVILWGTTLYNFCGVRWASRLNIVGALFGTLLPGILIVILGAVWLFTHHSTDLGFTSLSHYLPSPHVASVVFFLSVLSGYSGMQVTAFHVTNVPNAQRRFPKAILLATVMIVLVTLLPALAIAVVIPPAHINIVDGMIQAFAQFFQVFHLAWLTPVLAVCMAVGVLASLSAWLLGPARGVQRAAEQGFFATNWAKTNRHGMPKNVLWVQGAIGTVLASVFLWLPSIKSAFWLLVALTSQFTVLVFILVFVSAMVLRYRHGKTATGFHVPGPFWVLVGVCLIAMLVCGIGFILGFLPPQQLAHIPHFAWWVVIGDMVILGVPFVIGKAHLD